MVRQAVENALTIHVDDRNHVGRIFRDQPEQFFSFDKSAAHAVNLELLIQRINVEDQHQPNETPNGLPKPGDNVFLFAKQEGGKASCQQQRNHYGGAPKEPLSTLDPADIYVVGLRCHKMSRLSLAWGRRDTGSCSSIGG